jgi:hypothetical protein
LEEAKCLLDSKAGSGLQLEKEKEKKNSGYVMRIASTQGNMAFF